MNIINSIKNAIKSKQTLFTTPGHSQGEGVLAEFEALVGRKVFEADFSEIAGLDNLQHPSGAIHDSLKGAGEIYASGASFYLVNGSSSGIVALMLSVIKPGEKVLIARNCHKSLINALVLSGGFPVWVDTEWIDDWNISGQVKSDRVEKILNINPDIKAVFITSPTYEGVVSDVASISQVCQNKKIPLIVDEAHGSLWNFHKDLPIPAMHLGADACVQSLHKTASCLTQGAILHLSKNSRISPEKIQQCLNIINTTSPSYILLASIEASIEYLDSDNGRKQLSNLLDNIDSFREELSLYPDISLLNDNSGYKTDKTKLLIKINGVSGDDLADFLEEHHNIEVELNNNKSILALTGIGADSQKLDELAQAVSDARNSLKKTNHAGSLPLVSPRMILSPKEAFYQGFKMIDVQESPGCISKETIVTYPPGIPVLIAGEIVREDHLKFLENHKSIAVISE